MKGKDLFGKNKHIIGMIIVTILAVLFLMYLAFGSSQVHKVGNESSTNLHYVLVNEDLGGNFNNKNYRLGDLFVKRIYGDTSNSWKTTSRSVANAGFKDGTYDVEIIIPQNFSKDLLSLAAFNPNKAQIEYHIKPGINSLVNSNIEKRVGEILNQFNQSIVQMYFSSILSNISDAQRNVLNIVANENDNKKTLVTNINNPFKTYPVNLQSILGEESTLASTNKSWQDSQNAFTSSTTNMLNTFSTGLNGKVGEITDFGTLAKEISDLNIKNGQEYINQQNISDTENYKKQYDLIMGLMNSQMEELYKKGDGETSEDTGTYVDVKNDIEKYLQDSVDTVKTKIEELKTEKESLVSLRKDIALKYFGEEDATPGNEDNEKVKEAIVNLIDTGAKGDKSLVKGYINKIKDQVGNIQNTLENNLITMHENGEITDTDFEKYEKEIALVRKFASDEGVSFSTARTLAIINSDNSDEEKTGDFTKPLSLALPVGETTILDLDKADNTSLSLANKETLAKEIGKASKKAGLDCQVESYGTNGLKITLSDLPSSSENSNVENQDDSVITGTTENTNTQSPVVSDENGDDNEKGIDTNTSSPVKTTLSVDLPIELKWTYGNKFKTTEYMETTYDWVTTNPEVKNSKEVVGSGTLGAYHDLDVRARTITQNLGEIAGQLGELKSAADEITFLFGESNETGVEDFDNYYYHAITLNGGIRLRDSADPTSIYYSYGSLTLTQKKQYIPSNILEGYKTSGEELYNSLTTQINAIEATIGSDDTSDSLLNLVSNISNPTEIETRMGDILTWYDTTLNALNEQYNTWAKNPTLTASIKPYDEKTDGELSLYYDKDGSSKLVKDFTEFFNSTNEQATTTKAAAKKIGDLSKSFANLQKETKNVQDATKKTLNDTNSLVSKVSKDVKDNDGYSKNFSQVMKNSHIGGADNPAVFNFLSNPVGLVGGLDEETSVSVIPYLMTIIGMMVTVFAAFVIKAGDKKRKDLRSVGYFERSIFWKNMPTSMKAIASSVVLSIAVGIISQLVIHSKEYIQWVLYTVLAISGMILIATYLIRQITKLSGYIIGVIIGIYLLLAPVTGQIIESHTPVSVLYRISPLQNIENGYRAIYSGLSVGFISYAVMILIVVAGIVLNLVVKKTEV